MICWPIRAQPHCVTKRAPVNIFPFATAFFIICAVWSGTDAQHIYTHSLQHHNKFSPRRLFRPFYPLCAKTRSKNRSGPSRDIALLTIYNCILCRLISPPHLRPLNWPIYAQKFPTFFLFFHLGSFTQEREGCIVKPPHTRTLMHSPQLSHPLAS